MNSLSSDPHRSIDRYLLDQLDLDLLAKVPAGIPVPYQAAGSSLGSKGGSDTYDRVNTLARLLPAGTMQ